MAFESTGMDYGNDVAAEDYRASGQYTFCDITATGMKRLSTAGAPAFGVIQNAPNLNQAISVRFIGVSKTRTGGVFAKGDAVASDALGRAVKAAAGQQVLGKAMMASTGADQIAPVALIPGLMVTAS